MSFTFLTAVWRKLIMAQYSVDAAVLQPYLPAGLELDLYRGPDGLAKPQCFVSLVGFLFDRVRILGLPVPFHTRFEEVNLRFYVRRPLPADADLAKERTTEPGYRRGVVFIRETVPKPLITLTARALYGEAYATAKTRHEWRADDPAQFATTELARNGAQPELQVGYAWKPPGMPWQSMRVDADNTLQPIAPASVEEFTTEHYWGYTRRRGKDAASPASTAEYAVDHERWQVYPVRSAAIQCDFAQYGPVFASLTGREPDNVLLAEGAPVSIRWAGTLAAS